MPDDEKSGEEKGVKSDATNNIFATTTAPLPPFWHEMPDLWFKQIEAQFKARKITSDDTKFAHTVAVLPVDIIATVSDIISNPPENQTFEYLKTEVIKRKTLSEAQRIEKLLGTTGMGNQTPSEFFRRLQNLAGSSIAVNEHLLKSLWLKWLPTSIRAVCAFRENDSMQELCTIADKIWELTPSTSSSIYSTATTENVINGAGTSSITLDSLHKSICELKAQMNTRQSFRPRSRSKFRSRRFSRQRSKSRNASRSPFRSNTGYCWYHDKYGIKAKKCNDESCTFKKSSSITSTSGN